MNGRWMLLVALTGLMGCPPGEDAREDAVLALTGDVSSGASLYASRCETCHLADGTGGGAFPDIGVYLSSHDEADLVRTMIEGPGTMPSFEGSTDQELADILAYAVATF